MPDYTVPPNFEVTLQKAGWKVDMRDQAMEHLDTSKIFDRPEFKSCPLKFERILTMEQYDKLLDVTYRTYEFPPDTPKDPVLDRHPAFFTENGDGNQTWFGYLGILDGKPVATATSIVLHNLKRQYVWDVAVLPEFRKRGFGRRLQRIVVTWRRPEQEFLTLFFMLQKWDFRFMPN